MSTITIKVPSSLDDELQKASQSRHISKSELVRRAIVAYLGSAHGQAQPETALSLAGDLVGCFVGGPKDLASNPEHLADFGRV
jgi:hypothetical protein